jgi:hypothetical protein
MTTLVLNTFVVRDEAGELDVDGTMEKFQGVLLQYQAERETELATIGAAVNAVFDNFRGTAINMPALTTLTLQRLNCQPETCKALTARILDYVRSNAGTVFQIAKGKGGGVSRISDAAAK